MMRLSIDTIKQVAEYVKKKPAEYLHMCTGSNDFRKVQKKMMLNQWNSVQVIDCCRAGRENDLTPRCKECDGKHDAGPAKLRGREKSFNHGIDRFMQVLEGE